MRMQPGKKTRALSRSVESQLIALCDRPAPYTIEPLPVPDREAPSTLAELLEATRAPWRDENGALLGTRIPVSTAHSARTIWSAPAVNWLWRAFHDSHHILLGTEFDLRGELETARYAVSQFRGKPERAIVWADLGGQTLYFDRWGAFPWNQRDFVRDCIVRGVDAAVSSGLYHRETV